MLKTAALLWGGLCVGDNLPLCASHVAYVSDAATRMMVEEVASSRIYHKIKWYAYQLEEK